MIEEIAEVAEGLALDRSTWTLVKFGNVAIQQKENVNRENTDLTRYVAGEHMGSEDLHLRNWGDVNDDYLGPAFIRKFEAGDILYGSRRTYLRKVAVAHFDGITANTTFVIKPNEELIVKELLPFVMLSESFTQHSIRNSKGSVNPYINWKDIASYEFLLPPKDQQEQIAELLWAGDEMNEKNLEFELSLARLKDALYRRYFESETIEKIRIEECGKVFSGGTPDRKQTEFWGGDIPWVKTAEVNYNVIEDTEEKITEIGLKNSAAKLIKSNSVLIAMYGQGVTRGRVALTRIPVTCNQACAVIEPFEGFLPEYIYAYLEYKYEDLRSLAHGANQQNLNLNMIKSYAIPNLDLDTQSILVDELRMISDSKNSLAESIQDSKKLITSIINQIF